MYTDIYTASLPPELLAMAETPVMQRLLRVGMHCGCEYTAYPIYATPLRRIRAIRIRSAQRPSSGTSRMT